jgi:hypothetical protein
VSVGLANPEPVCRACAARVASEPAYREALAATQREPSSDALPPFRLSPLTRYQKAGAALAARIAADPELRQARVEAARWAAAMRRKCGQCPMVTSPPNLALHQRASGHTGWEAVS